MRMHAAALLAALAILAWGGDAHAQDSADTTVPDATVAGDDRAPVDVGAHTDEYDRTLGRRSFMTQAHSLARHFGAPVRIHLRDVTQRWQRQATSHGAHQTLRQRGDVLITNALTGEVLHAGPFTMSERIMDVDGDASMWWTFANDSGDEVVQLFPRLFHHAMDSYDVTFEFDGLHTFEMVAKDGVWVAAWSGVYGDGGIVVGDESGD